MPMKIKVVSFRTLRASKTVLYSNLPNLSEILKLFNIRGENPCTVNNQLFSLHYSFIKLSKINY